MRTLVLGDQHGYLNKVKTVLDKCNFDPTSDRIINLGDIADGGPETAQLVQFWIDLNLKDSVFIRGNHDVWAYEFIKFGLHPSPTQGGLATMKSYEDWEDYIPHVQFFENQVDYFVENEVLFVHGGYKTHPEKTVFLGDLHWDRSLWLGAMSGSYKSYDFREVFLGHTSTRQWRCKKHYPEYPEIRIGEKINIPMNRMNVWNLDTGAGWDNKLTIMDINTKQYWQS